MHYVFSFQVKDCVKELGKLLYPLLIHRQSKVFLNFRPNFQISRLSFFHSTNYSTSSRAGRALYWSNYKIINNSNGPSSNPPEMMREGELPLISISERALATKVRQQLQFLAPIMNQLPFSFVGRRWLEREGRRGVLLKYHNQDRHHEHPHDQRHPRHHHPHDHHQHNQASSRQLFSISESQLDVCGRPSIIASSRPEVCPSSHYSTVQ